MALAGMRKRPAYVLYQWGWRVLDWLYPPFCGGCGKFGLRWCSECQNSIHHLYGNICAHCGSPTPTFPVCSSCLNNPPPYRYLRSLALYEGPLRNAILGLKYHHNIGLSDNLAENLITLYNQLQWPIDIIVPVPLSLKRMRERGYNQASLIAHSLAISQKKDITARALKRIRNTRSQVGLNFEERQKNVHQAFKADPKLVQGKNILLIDDVATTGATLGGCTRALLDAGAAEVYAMTLARAMVHDDVVS